MLIIDDGKISTALQCVKKVLCAKQYICDELSWHGSGQMANFSVYFVKSKFYFMDSVPQNCLAFSIIS